MRLSTGLRIIVFSTIVAVPFAVKGGLVIVARIWRANLRPTLPWLHTLRWVLWTVGMMITIFALIRSGGVQFSLFTIGMALNTSATGFGMVEGWVKRRYAPELVAIESPDGWWPSPRN
jgi:hypothetical protein